MDDLISRLRRVGRSQSRRHFRLWQGIVLALATLVISLSPHPGFTQSSSTDFTTTAPVLLDGQEVLQIGGSGRLTARERADIISQSLRSEVRPGEAIELEVIPDKQIAIIRSQTTQSDLVTVTPDDLAGQPNAYSQAIVWRRQIEAALEQAQYERTLGYVRQAVGFSLGVVLGAIAIHLSLRFLGRILLRRFTSWLSYPTSPLHPWEQSVKLLLKLSVLGIQGGLWAAVAFYVTDLFPDVRSWRNRLLGSLNAQVITLGSRDYSALSLLLMLASAVGLWFAVSAVTRLFRFYVLRGTGVERRIQDVISVLTQYILTFLGLIILFQLWGIDVSSLAILASVLGVGIGFGVQNITNNLISGLIITLERPIQMGDFVQVGELVGVVEHIGARSTQVCTLDQVTILVPNSRFLESEVVNWSHGNPISRLHIPVGVAYGSQVEHVQQALLEAARSHPDVLIKPPPEVWFQEFGDSALKFELLVWTGEPKNQFRVKSDLYYRIEASLRRYEIEVPFPQRDLHVRSPQIEEFLANFGEYALPRPSSLPLVNGRTSVPSSLTPSAASGADPGSSASPQSKPLQTQTDLDLEAIATKLREPDGLAIVDRRYRGNLYPRCFTGTELVEWLVQHQSLSRGEALHIGQQLIDRHIIHHVVDDRPFEDGYLFYRFYTDDS